MQQDEQWFGDEGEIRVTSDGAVRIVTLHRPDVLNAVNESLQTALLPLWGYLADDNDVAAVVFTGAGRVFSAGGDIDYIRRFLDEPELRRQTIEDAEAILWAMARFPLPLIAAVNGPAVGLGMSPALGADIVLMSDRASFADPISPSASCVATVTPRCCHYWSHCCGRRNCCSPVTGSGPTRRSSSGWPTASSTTTTFIPRRWPSLTASLRNRDPHSGRPNERYSSGSNTRLTVLSPRPLGPSWNRWRRRSAQR